MYKNDDSYYWGQDQHIYILHMELVGLEKPREKERSIEVEIIKSPLWAGAAKSGDDDYDTTMFGSS